MQEDDKRGLNRRRTVWALLGATVSIAVVVVLVVYVALPALTRRSTTPTALPTQKIQLGDPSYRILAATGTPDGSLWFTEEQYQSNQGGTSTGPAKIVRVTPGGVLSEYPLTNGNSFAVAAFSLGQLTLAADGNLWFEEAVGAFSHSALPRSAVGEIDANGHVSDYTLPFLSNQFFQPTFASPLVHGPDGNIWFLVDVALHLGTSPESTVSTAELASITPAGKFTAVPLSGTVGASYGNLTVGPDGNFWTTISPSEQGASLIACITPTGDVNPYPPHTAGETAVDITVGEDGHLWAGLLQSGAGLLSKIARITPKCERSLTPTLDVTEFGLPSAQSSLFPNLVASGGDIWFPGADYTCTSTACSIGQSWIGSIAPAGTLNEYKVPTASLVEALYPGPDGDLYYVGLSSRAVPYAGNNLLGRVTPAGRITEYGVSTQSQDAFNLVAGQGKTLWLTASVGLSEQGRSSIMRMTLP